MRLTSLISAQNTTPTAINRHDQEPAIRSACGTSASSRLTVDECCSPTGGPTSAGGAGGDATDWSTVNSFPGPASPDEERAAARPDAYARRTLARSCSKRFKRTPCR
ncbi:hypothetical protein GCM10027605_06480 [Micromonospora zhanjiangensis]